MNAEKRLVLRAAIGYLGYDPTEHQIPPNSYMLACMRAASGEVGLDRQGSLIENPRPVAIVRKLLLEAITQTGFFGPERTEELDPEVEEEPSELDEADEEEAGTPQPENQRADYLNNHLRQVLRSLDRFGKYEMWGGKQFTFMHVAEPEYGLLFGHIDGRQAYACVRDLLNVPIKPGAEIEEPGPEVLEELQAEHRNLRAAKQEIIARLAELEQQMAPLFDKAAERREAEQHARRFAEQHASRLLRHTGLEVHPPESQDDE